jgi:hypothetical protein
MLTEPGEMLQWINHELLEQNIDKYVALLFGVCDLESQEIRLVNGGHYPPAVLVRDGARAFVEQKGKPVGCSTRSAIRASGLRWKPGDRLVMFSDGVLDALQGDRSRCPGGAPAGSRGGAGQQRRRHLAGAGLDLTDTGQARRHDLPDGAEGELILRGRIMVGDHDGVYVLLFQGDVRLTLCTAVDAFLDRMFQDAGFKSVWLTSARPRASTAPRSACWRSCPFRQTAVSATGRR